SAPESSGLTPNVQKHLAYEILSGRRVPDKADEKPEDPHVVAGKQNLHRLLVAPGNRANQRYVRRVRALPAGASNGVELARAADGHDVSPSPQLSQVTIRPFRRCHLPPILYRLYRDALATALTTLDEPFRVP